jgi:hypothetical protein
MILSNFTNLEYTNLDLLVQSNLKFAEAGIHADFNQCIIGPQTPGTAGFHIGGMTLSLGNKPIPLYAMKPDAASVYRLSCEKLKSGSQIEVVFAVVPNPINDSEKSLRWTIVSAEYEAGYRKRGPVFKPVCFVSSCETEIPYSFNSVHYFYANGQVFVVGDEKAPRPAAKR